MNELKFCPTCGKVYFTQCTSCCDKAALMPVLNLWTKNQIALQVAWEVGRERQRCVTMFADWAAEHLQNSQDEVCELVAKILEAPK